MNEPIGTVACVNLEGTHRYIREMVAETMTPDNLMSVGEVNINNEQDAINYSSAASKEFNMAIPFVPPIVEIQTWSPEKMKRDLKKDYEILKKEGMEKEVCVKVDDAEFREKLISNAKALLENGITRKTSELGRCEAALNGMNRAEVEYDVLAHTRAVLEEMSCITHRVFWKKWDWKMKLH